MSFTKNILSFTRNILSFSDEVKDRGLLKDKIFWAKEKYFLLLIMWWEKKEKRSTNFYSHNSGSWMDIYTYMGSWSELYNTGSSLYIYHTGSSIYICRFVDGCDTWSELYNTGSSGSCTCSQNATPPSLVTPWYLKNVFLMCF